MYSFVFCILLCCFEVFQIAVRVKMKETDGNVNMAFLLSLDLVPTVLLLLLLLLQPLPPPLSLSSSSLLSSYALLSLSIFNVICLMFQVQRLNSWKERSALCMSNILRLERNLHWVVASAEMLIHSNDGGFLAPVIFKLEV